VVPTPPCIICLSPRIFSVASRRTLLQHQHSCSATASFIACSAHRLPITLVTSLCLKSWCPSVGTPAPVASPDACLTLSCLTLCAPQSAKHAQAASRKLQAAHCERRAWSLELCNHSTHVRRSQSEPARDSWQSVHRAASAQGTRATAAYSQCAARAGMFMHAPGPRRSCPCCGAPELSTHGRDVRALCRLAGGRTQPGARDRTRRLCAGRHHPQTRACGCVHLRPLCSRNRPRPPGAQLLARGLCLQCAAHHPACRQHHLPSRCAPAMHAFHASAVRRCRSRCAAEGCHRRAVQRRQWTAAAGMWTFRKRTIRTSGS
jgi:hypothetical protein